jgi:hypothetical protein
MALQLGCRRHFSLHVSRVCPSAPNVRVMPSLLFSHAVLAAATQPAVSGVFVGLLEGTVVGELVVGTVVGELVVGTVAGELVVGTSVGVLVGLHGTVGAGVVGGGVGALVISVSVHPAQAVMIMLALSDHRPDDSTGKPSVIEDFVYADAPSWAELVIAQPHPQQYIIR